MKEATKRAIWRTVHLILAIPIFGYIFSPFDQLPNYAFPTRYIFFPAMVLSGLWMWKGHAVRRLIFRRSQDAAANSSRLRASPRI
jgi:hypothetical protein